MDRKNQSYAAKKSQEKFPSRLEMPALNLAKIQSYSKPGDSGKHFQNEAKKLKREVQKRKKKQQQ